MGVDSPVSGFIPPLLMPPVYAIETFIVQRVQQITQRCLYPLYLSSRVLVPLISSGGRTVEIPKGLSLAAFFIEIRRIEPGLEVHAQRRPFVIEDREPGRVAIHALE